MLSRIRNFSIIAHIDHGKSTLADRMLELTGTVEKRKMHDQVLDRMELEQERGITIKMQPVQMRYHLHRGKDADSTRNDAEKEENAEEELLYKDLSYKIRGVLFAVRKNLGLGHKEQVYHSALEIEFKKAGLPFESKKNIPIRYDSIKIGTYQPDFVIDNKILIELKALPEIGRPQIEQVWSYLKGCEYTLALLANYGSRDLEIKRIVYDTARNSSALSALSQRVSAQVEDECILNLIDTPGHIDFSYEVSRALTAVEGVILVVDASQGVQAQTFTVLHQAEELGLTIIPVVNKIDLPIARTAEVKEEVATLLKVSKGSILEVSGKTGEGVDALLEAVVRRIPPPRETFEGTKSARALVFDFEYSTHRGVSVYVRVLDGTLRAGAELILTATGERFTASEVGIFTPDQKTAPELGPGAIGYIVTGIKQAGEARVGDTVTLRAHPLPPLPGYRQPKPVVWASIYPENQLARPSDLGRSGGDDFTLLRQALTRLRLSDAALTFEEESSGTLGRGFRCGFLGMLHLEIVTERLRREFRLTLIVATPTISYRVLWKDGHTDTVYSPSRFPDESAVSLIHEPWVSVRIITPPDYLGALVTLLYEHEAEMGETQSFGESRVALSVAMPLRELMRNFFDALKSASSGYASLSYEYEAERPADVVRLDILVNEELVPAFSRVVSHRRVQEEAERAAARLKSLLPPQLIVIKIQARALGRILAAERITALRKDVTGYLYGGDITRKMKLREKQKKGKKKMQKLGKISIPSQVFLQMVRQGGS